MNGWLVHFVHSSREYIHAFHTASKTDKILPVLVGSQTDKICEESLSSIIHVFSLPSSVFLQVFFLFKDIVLCYYIFNINTLKLLKNIKNEI
jgi:ABC-type spermidine/putrescine transport system permease subunit II